MGPFLKRASLPAWLDRPGVQALQGAVGPGRTGRRLPPGRAQGGGRLTRRVNAPAPFPSARGAFLRREGGPRRVPWAGGSAPVARGL